MLRCFSFCNIGTSVDLLISREGYPRGSLVGMGFRDETCQSAVFILQGGRLESPNEVWLCRCQSALFEAGLAISSRHVAFVKLLL